MVFIVINWRWDKIDKLEGQGKWNDAKNLLLSKWLVDPSNPKTTIRLGFFCWFVLVEHFPLGIIDVELDELESVLREVTDHGLIHFASNEDFLWCFGYMIALFPYYFGDYEHWEKKGELMLKQAYEMQPNDPVYKYSYMCSLPNSRDKYKAEFEQIQSVLEQRFPGDGVLSNYFKSVWQRN